VLRIGVRGINVYGRAEPATTPHFCSIRQLVSLEVSQRYVAEEHFGYLLTVKWKKLLLRSVCIAHIIAAVSSCVGESSVSVPEDAAA